MNDARMEAGAVRKRRHQLEVGIGGEQHEEAAPGDQPFARLLEQGDDIALLLAGMPVPVG